MKDELRPIGTIFDHECGPDLTSTEYIPGRKKILKYKVIAHSVCMCPKTRKDIVCEEIKCIGVRWS